MKIGHNVPEIFCADETQIVASLWQLQFDQKVPAGTFHENVTNDKANICP